MPNERPHRCFDGLTVDQSYEHVWVPRALAHVLAHPALFVRVYHCVIAPMSRQKSEEGKPSVRLRHRDRG